MDSRSSAGCLICWIAPSSSPLCSLNLLAQTSTFFGLLLTWIGYILSCSSVVDECLSDCSSMNVVDSAELMVPEPNSCPKMYSTSRLFQLAHCSELSCGTSAPAPSAHQDSHQHWRSDCLISSWRSSAAVAWAACSYSWFLLCRSSSAAEVRSRSYHRTSASVSVLRKHCFTIWSNCSASDALCSGSTGYSLMPQFGFELHGRFVEVGHALISIPDLDNGWYFTVFSVRIHLNLCNELASVGFIHSSFITDSSAIVGTYSTNYSNAGSPMTNSYTPVDPSVIISVDACSLNSDCFGKSRFRSSPSSDVSFGWCRDSSFHRYCFERHRCRLFLLLRTTVWSHLAYFPGIIDDDGLDISGCHLYSPDCFAMRNILHATLLFCQFLCDLGWIPFCCLMVDTAGSVYFESLYLLVGCMRLIERVAELSVLAMVRSSMASFLFDQSRLW